MRELSKVGARWCDRDRRCWYSMTAGALRPREYVVTLNTAGDRNGISGTRTPLQDFDEIRVVVR